MLESVFALAVLQTLSDSKVAAELSIPHGRAMAWTPLTLEYYAPSFTFPSLGPGNRC